MGKLRQWAEILGEEKEEKRMHVNLKYVLESQIKRHPNFQKVYEMKLKFYVEYTDMTIAFEQKGWTIYKWELVKQTGHISTAVGRSGLVFGTEGVLEVINQLRAEKDGVKYEKPKPKVQVQDPIQRLYEMERFRPKLEAALRRHPLFVSTYMAQELIFIVYWDILLAVKPTDYGNFQYELYERLGKVETKLCKCGSTIGEGGVIDAIKDLRSAWDRTHDPPQHRDCDRF